MHKPDDIQYIPSLSSTSRGMRRLSKLLQMIQQSFLIVVSLLVLVVDHTVHSHYHLFLTMPSSEFWQEIDFVDVPAHH